ncbi:hypothetical protein N431DRAFT_452975 [Stipitochalara longipes BDJ]|nr:hypothetical protein N431DRAFT_452975 [Stipitochalara longipes BDJ]
MDLRKIWSRALPGPQSLQLIISELHPNYTSYIWPKSYCRDERIYIGGFRLACWESNQIFNQIYAKIAFIGGPAALKPPRQFIDFRNDTLSLDYSDLSLLEEIDARIDLKKCQSVVITAAYTTQPDISSLWKYAKECSSLATLTITLGALSSLSLEANRPVLMEVDQNFIDVVTTHSNSSGIDQPTNSERDQQLRGYIAQADRIQKEFLNYSKLHPGEWKGKKSPCLCSHLGSTNLSVIFHQVKPNWFILLF